MSTPRPSSKIVGTGSAFPKRIVSNAELCRMLEGVAGEPVEGFSPEWIRKVTGIERRHFSGPDETVSALAATAGRIACEAAGITPFQIDGIIVATCTPDTPLPAAATLVQKKLGASRAFAFDLNAACSGFHHAWASAHAMIVAGLAKHVLVVGADVLTSITDFTDRKSCILFGDGAGAAILSRVEDAKAEEIPRFLLAADGEGFDMLHVPAGGSERPIHGHVPGAGFDPRRPSRLGYSETRMHMKGHDIFKASVRTMVELGEKVLASAGKTAEDVDFVVPHQANLRILERVAKQQKLPLERFVMNITERGNTSAATVPTALDQGIREGKIKRGHRLLVPVFGAGVTAGAAYAVY